MGKHNVQFDFPLVEGAELPFEGYELLSVGVNVIFNVIGEAYDVNFALKARFLDNWCSSARSTSAINDGQGNFVFTNIEPGTYRMVIGSDINGDNSYGAVQVKCLDQVLKTLKLLIQM